MWSELSRAVDPARVEPGDILIGLRSSGVHSNGFSLVRKIVEHASLDLDAVHPELDDERTLAEVLLEPTRIYAKPIVKLLSSYRVKKVVSGMAHITGGGLPGNLNRALHDRVAAEVKLGSWEIPTPLRFPAEARGCLRRGDDALSSTWGIGYVLIVRPTFADAVMRKLERFGEEPVRMGRIVKGKGDVRFR